MVAIIGFASQKAFSNIISGIFILIFKPFRVKDTIEFLDSTKGVVEEITLRHTIIRNYENRSPISAIQVNVNYRYSTLDRYGQMGSNHGLVVRLVLALE